MYKALGKTYAEKILADSSFVGLACFMYAVFYSNIGGVLIYYCFWW